jgi:ketosteroid isomerase-like protein
MGSLSDTRRVEIDVNEIARKAVEAFNARDLVAWMDMCSPEIELRSRFSGGPDSAYVGYDGLRQWHKDLMEAWESITLELEGVFEADAGKVVTLHHVVGRSRTSGVELEDQIAHVIEHRDGVIQTLTVYTNRDEAMRAVRG